MTPWPPACYATGVVAGPMIAARPAARQQTATSVRRCRHGPHGCETGHISCVRRAARLNFTAAFAGCAVTGWTVHNRLASPSRPYLQREEHLWFGKGWSGGPPLRRSVRPAVLT